MKKLLTILFLIIVPMSVSAFKDYPKPTPLPEFTILNPAPKEEKNKPDDKKLRSFKSGTGFYVNRTGYLITNNHVVEDCGSINVKADGVKKTEARIIARDVDKDLALLLTEKRAKNIAPLRYDKGLKKGDGVMVIGYPGIRGVSREYLVRTANVIDSVGPNGEKDWVQFSDSTAKGNSGGPLLDMNGNVIGVVTAKITRTNRKTGAVMAKSDVAVNMMILKKFLDKNNVHYDRMFTYNPQNTGFIEKKARKFIVSIRCFD